MQDVIPFLRVDHSEVEAAYVAAAMAGGGLRGGGVFTRRCEERLTACFAGSPVLLTSSCTHALEMAALLLDVQSGDEVICPSWTFVSTANAFALRGARIVFVDVDPGTLTLDLDAVRAAISPRTVGVVPVHYAGVSCDMVALSQLAESHGLWVVEDAAQSILACFDGRPLGTFGKLAAVSFHETKNVTAGGEGGALIINDARLLERAEIIREKGTDRERLRRSEVNRYRWLELGSSYLMSELQAAYLLGQLERVDELQARRMACWNHYQRALEPFELAGHIVRPRVPLQSSHNAHGWFLQIQDVSGRSELQAHCARGSVQVATHYEPLHESPAGLRFGRSSGPLPVTTRAAASLLRLPLWPAMDTRMLDRVVDVLTAFFRASRPSF